MFDEETVESVHLLALINLGLRGQLHVPSGVAPLLRTTAQGPSFFASIFVSMGNVGGRPSSVIPPPPLPCIWRVGGCV